MFKSFLFLKVLTLSLLPFYVQGQEQNQRVMAVTLEGGLGQTT